MNAAFLSGIGLLLAVGALFYLAYANFHNIYVAVGATVVLAVFSQLPVWGTISGNMMGDMANYIKLY